MTLYIVEEFGRAPENFGIIAAFVCFAKFPERGPYKHLKIS